MLITRTENEIILDGQANLTIIPEDVGAIRVEDDGLETDLPKVRINHFYMMAIPTNRKRRISVIWKIVKYCWNLGEGKQI